MKHSASGGQAPETWQVAGFGLYVHWPFCESKCPYCDFNSHVAQAVPQRQWAEALVGEVRAWAARTPGRVLSSIFFGGGTPSLMAPETLGEIILAAQECWTFANDIEITMEANPSSVEAGRFQAFRDSGVNRLSLGIQSLDDEALRLLGRRHSAAQALAAWDVTRRVFDRASFDLIYARQFQDTAAWELELRRALDLEPTHVSLYQLTIEDGTAFGARHSAGKLPGLPSEEIGADQFDLTQALCDVRGLGAYEVSNHARPGEESRHNLTYWRGGDYVGVGPGAHGRITLAQGRIETEAEHSPSAWLSAARLGAATGIERILSVRDVAVEYLVMGLRIREGIDLNRYLSLGGSASIVPKISDLCADGLLWVDGQHVGTTARGRPLTNAILRDLS